VTERTLSIPRQEDGTRPPWATAEHPVMQPETAEPPAAGEGPGEPSITFRVRDVLSHDLTRYLDGLPRYRNDSRD